MKFKFNLTVQIFLAMGLGVLVGLLVHNHLPSDPEAELPLYFDLIVLVGDIFMKLLRMIIVPLIMASIIMGVVSIGDLSKLGRVGGKTFTYYFGSTFLAVIVGLIVVNLVKPGVGFPTQGEPLEQVTENEPPSFLEIIEDIVPTNIFAAMAESDVLSLIFFSLIFGAVLTTLRDKAKGMIGFFEALNHVMMKLTDWIMRIAPIGIFALIAKLFATVDAGQTLGPLLKYMLSVVGGLLIHAVITLPLLLWIFARYSPLKFFSKMLAAITTAFSTASSAATLPVTMECLQDNVGVSKRTTSFVLPLGATINMDGTALYESIAALFIAQMYGIELTLTQQCVVFLTATLASIGAAAIPSAGLFTIVIVLEAVNFPAEQIAVGLGIIYGVDRILDMFRTAVNVWGDSVGATVVARLEGETLKA